MAHGREDFTYLADTDIIAQTIGSIAVDIAAQTLAEMSVNIIAQDLAELLINVVAQDVGIYLQPEWAALQGVDKNFHTFELDRDFGEGTSTGVYTVPAGKTLYLCGLSFEIHANLAADGDNAQHGRAFLYNLTDNIVLAIIGGNGGGAISFPKPIVVEASHVLHYTGTCLANHACDISVTTWGYEL